ncbi:26S protease regulatory subunit 8, partial [Paramuricea clavata]
MAAAGLSVISSFNNENRNILKNDDLHKARSNKAVKMEIEIDKSHEGIQQYYVTKIEELQLTVTEKVKNLRRLEAQRNELNAK